MGVRNRFSTEQIIHKLREAEVELAKGRTVSEVCKQIGVTDQTYFRWRQSHGGLKVDRATRLRNLEAENTGLKKAVAELTIDKIILKDVAEGKCQARRISVKPLLWCARNTRTRSD